MTCGLERTCQGRPPVRIVMSVSVALLPPWHSVMECGAVNSVRSVAMLCDWRLRRSSMSSFSFQANRQARWFSRLAPLDGEASETSISMRASGRPGINSTRWVKFPIWSPLGSRMVPRLRIVVGLIRSTLSAVA